MKLLHLGEGALLRQTLLSLPMVHLQFVPGEPPPAIRGTAFGSRPSIHSPPLLFRDDLICCSIPAELISRCTPHLSEGYGPLLPFVQDSLSHQALTYRFSSHFYHATVASLPAVAVVLTAGILRGRCWVWGG